MTLYVPSHFRVEDRAELIEFMRANAFATLVSSGAMGLHVSHIPLIADAGADGSVRLLGHVARANPQWSALEGADHVVAIFDQHCANQQRTLCVARRSSDVESRRADKRSAAPPAIVRLRPLANICICDLSGAPSRSSNYGRKTIYFIPTIHPCADYIEVTTGQCAHCTVVIGDQFITEEAVDNPGIPQLGCEKKD